ncbi:MAG TPA: hypothetical protein VMO20_08555 [Candidatus Acidoferrum sp.]|nr:hypothetical protein [Candidatus Acidoferrum sp.]
MAWLEIRAAPVPLPWKRKENRAGREQKRTAFDFPMQISLGNIVDFQSPVPVFWQPGNAAAAVFFKKIEELTRLMRQLSDHAVMF